MTRAGRNATRVGPGSSGAVSTRPRAIDAAGPLTDQLGGAIGADARHPRLLALLEPAARLGSKREPLRRPPDAHGVEDRRLDRDLARRVRDLRRRAAHDASDPDRPIAVCDQQHVGRELALNVVQRLEALTLDRAPDDDRRPSAGTRVNRSPIEGVDRLAELEHHVVRGVDDVRDRPLPCGEEAHLDAIRRRPDGHAAHPAPDEPSAQLRVADVHGEPLGGRGSVALLENDLGEPDPLAGRRGHLAREAQD